MPLELKIKKNYYFQKNGDRIYDIGHVLKVLPNKLLNKIRSWATFPFKNKLTYDQKIVCALLFVLHYKNANDEQKKATENFIRSEYFVTINKHKPIFHFFLFCFA